MNDIAPFREAFRLSGMTVQELADAMGVSDARVRVLLGLKKHYTYKKGKRYASTCMHVTDATAMKFAKAFGLDPVDLNF